MMQFKSVKQKYYEISNSKWLEISNCFAYHFLLCTQCYLKVEWMWNNWRTFPFFFYSLFIRRLWQNLQKWKVLICFESILVQWHISIPPENVRKSLSFLVISSWYKIGTDLFKRRRWRQIYSKFAKYTCLLKFTLCSNWRVCFH